jgi:Ca2+-binding RTX toxin-like protein
VRVNLPTWVVGGGGRDDIRTAGGDDHISGGAGADTIDPGAGSDRVDGGRAVTGSRPCARAERVCRLMPVMPGRDDTPTARPAGCVDSCRVCRDESTHPPREPTSRLSRAARAGGRPGPTRLGRAAPGRSGRSARSARGRVAPGCGVARTAPGQAGGRVPEAWQACRLRVGAALPAVSPTPP